MYSVSKRLSVIFIALLLALGLSSPARGDKHSAASAPSRFVTFPHTRPPVDVSNPANQVDFVGQLHNEGLDYAIANKARLGNDPRLWTLRVQQLTSEYLCANESRIGQLFSGMTPGTLPDDCSMTDGEVSFLAELQQLQDNATSLGFANFIAAVKGLEASVAAQPMSTREKVITLGACSVARYSAAYWYSETQLATSLWATLPSGTPSPLSINWGDVGKQDVEGAVGGLIGSLFGGPITWLGAGLGALGGAIAGSAVEIIDQLW
jgi:hypothetical protein